MTVLLTGATGFIGMEVLARLLERGEQVAAVVRARDSAGARDRLDGVLATLYRDPAPYRDRVRPVLGDVAVADVDAPPADVVIHCAASIAFTLPVDEARAVNVEGTRRMLAAARRAGARRFVHVSTAYVAGRTTGRWAEDQRDAGQDFRNTYERTKWEAEHLVADAADLSCAIARPSVVVGDSRSGWTPAFNVLYWPLRAFARGLFESVPALPQARVDVVPVDAVADGIVGLAGAESTGAFHLAAGEGAPTATELVELACARFGRPRPPFTAPGDSAGAATQGDGAVYLPYFDMELVLDTVRSRSELGLDVPPLARYFDTLMDYAELTRWGKRPLGREQARDAAATLPRAA
jgi:long-chain acyl-CoA synthetase